MLHRLKGFASEEGFIFSHILPNSMKKKKHKLFLFKFKDGDQKVFSEIYKRFRIPILNRVKLKISDQETAEEITQEIFLKVYRFRESYKEQYAFSTWLWTIARNTIADYLRGIKSAVNGSEHSSGDDFIMPEDLPSVQSSAEAVMIKKSERRHLLKKMRSLTRLQKKVLWMRLIHQHSYSEISKKLGLSLTAVKNLAYRGKNTLVEIFGFNSTAVEPIK